LLLGTLLILGIWVENLSAELKSTDGGPTAAPTAALTSEGSSEEDRRNGAAREEQEQEAAEETSTPGEPEYDWDAQD
jgi:ribosomal protein L12E/L44/L45/RPP1/RPP2